MRRWLRGLGALLALALAYCPGAQAAVPSFAELEAAQARIARVIVRPLDIFDTEDPRESNPLFRLANALHVTTRRAVIERSLLFRAGDRVQVRLIEETERLLRNARFLYDVSIRPVAVNEQGEVDIEVLTRDTWSLDPGLSFGRSGGANTSSLSLHEYNLLGTGFNVSVGRSNTVDRSGTEFQVGTERLGGSWTALSLAHAQNEDGQRSAVRLVRPFYALDSRWAAGFSASRDDRIDSIYQAGEPVQRYRRQEDRAEVFGGLSEGLVDGWVERWSVGLLAERDGYAVEPGEVPPAQLAPNETRVGPFVRWERIEDQVDTVRNLMQIGRPEYLPMGWRWTGQLGAALTGMGATREALLYAGRVSRGLVPAPGQRLMLAGSVEGRLTDAGIERQKLSATGQWFKPWSEGTVTYVGAAADLLTQPGPLDMLTLGGDNGLRGYPLRYQNGTQRALFSVEQRFYTDFFPFRLFRVGAAGFADVGRAWGGIHAGPTSERWLADVGVGLRIFSVRSAFNNALHIDLAMPVNPDAGVKRVQLLVKTRLSF